MTEPEPSESFANTAFIFELGLGMIAIMVGWFAAVDPLATVEFAAERATEPFIAMLQGVVATIPLLAGLYIVHRVPLSAVKGIREFVESHVVPLFKPLTLFELGAISFAAGFGEEALFRGLLQVGIADSVGGTYGVVVGVVAASILFGVCHWITPTYAILATLAGVYFGLLFVLTGNLLAPLVAHALYDFVALIYLTRGQSPETLTTGGK